MTTPTPAPLPRRALAGMITVAVLVGLNLRPSMAAVGPLADRIQAELGASYPGLALLTPLPVLAMAAGCFLGAGLARRLGDPALVVASLPPPRALRCCLYLSCFGSPPSSSSPS